MLLDKMKISETEAFIPQIIAASVASLTSILFGVNLVYSGILIPQINEEIGGVEVSKPLSTWIVSCVGLVMPVSSIISGYLMDHVGRLNVLKLSAIPNLIGWTIIALSTNGVLLLLGRIITGITIGMISFAPYVYIAEISSSNLRSALLGILSVCATIGILLTYLKGLIISWWLLAWITNVYTILITSLLWCIPESPTWLVSKNRLDQAKKSLKWLNKHQRENVDLLVEAELKKLQEEVRNRNLADDAGNLKLFRQPIVYKPIMIFTILSIIQQFAGVNIITMNAVDIFKDVGTQFDPYLAATYIATTRVLVSISLIWIMKRYGRRCILMVSCLGITVTMGVSGVYTKWIQDGVSDITWIPLSMFILYFVFAGSLYSVPFAFAGEVFPLKIRGVASNLMFAVTSVIMFGALQSYMDIQEFLGGSHGLQYMFAGVALIGFIFTYAFVPETRNKTLSEIENNFWTDTVYISCTCCKRNKL